MLTGKHILEKCLNCCALCVTSGRFVCLSFDSKFSGMLLLKKTINEMTNRDQTIGVCSGQSGEVSVASMRGALASKYIEIGRGTMGFSTGCLYQVEISLRDKLSVYLRAGATILELVFATVDDLMAFDSDDSLATKFRKFDSISVHAPWMGIRYFDGSGVTNHVMVKLTNICRHLNISGVVFHPDIIDSFCGLEIVEFPVLIENMDSRKVFGTTVSDIAQIKTDYDFGFVIDMQHIFEHDPSMKLAFEMQEAIGNERLSCLHVSGANLEYYHAPLFMSTNQDVICDTLKRIPGIPVIMEGVLSGDPAEAAKIEYEFVSQHGNPFGM